ncbi:MAG TPA: hypothetical protein VLF67_01385 [Candidatus Saccharimonas sp.]|nr:hypothetical protein [Candidatus Saccharimonas sp.]
MTQRSEYRRIRRLAAIWLLAGLVAAGSGLFLPGLLGLILFAVGVLTVLTALVKLAMPWVEVDFFTFWP